MRDGADIGESVTCEGERKRNKHEQIPSLNTQIRKYQVRCKLVGRFLAVRTDTNNVTR